MHDLLGQPAARERHDRQADAARFENDAPERFVAESLVAAFPTSLTNGRVLIARAEQARDALPEGLSEKGWAVEVLPVYRTVTVEPDPAALALVRSGAFDAITFTSSSTVTNACAVVGAWSPNAKH